MLRHFVEATLQAAYRGRFVSRLDRVNIAWLEYVQFAESLVDQLFFQSSSDLQMIGSQKARSPKGKVFAQIAESKARMMKVEGFTGMSKRGRS